MEIVYLYSELVGYTEGTLRKITELKPDAHITAVYWDKKKLSSYKQEKIDRVQYIPRSSLSTRQLKDLLISLSPEIVYVSGWMDKGYLKAIYSLKRKNKQSKVVVGIDAQWHGTIKQKLTSIIAKLFFKYFYDYVWIAGKPQYHTARMLGFKNENIISNLYSANSYYFKGRAGFEKRIVYLGRFSPEKGSLNLVKFYNKLSEDIKRNWPLVMIGDGPEKDEILKIKSNQITILPFLQGNELVNELLKGGIECSPSFRDQWGLVIHEMALMGYPLLISKVCGAATEFLIPGFNGFLFDPESYSSFEKAMEKINELNEEELKLYSDRSVILGNRISTEISASSILSVL